MYGLKGNIDATVQVSMSDGDGQKTLVVPLEVKTGRSNTNEGHRAQTALYTLLLSDRYGEGSCPPLSCRRPLLMTPKQISRSPSEFSTILRQQSLFVFKVSVQKSARCYNSVIDSLAMFDKEPNYPQCSRGLIFATNATRKQHVSRTIS